MTYISMNTLATIEAHRITVRRWLPHLFRSRTYDPLKMTPASRNRLIRTLNSSAFACGEYEDVNGNIALAYTATLPDVSNRGTEELPAVRS